jgi:hypothetical protein
VSAPTWRQTVSQLLYLAVGFPTAVYALGVLGWAVGMPVGGALAVAALFLCVAVLCATQRSEISAVLVATLALVGLGIAAVALAAATVDGFYDSQLYHLPATIALRDGWNPLENASACDFRKKFCLPHPGIDHYPKATWILSASLYSLTGSFEAGKGAQLITLLAAWIATARLLVSFRFLRPRLVGVLATVATWNPIALKQAASAYVDGWLASALLLFFVLLLDFIFHRRRVSLVLAAIALPFVLGFKFTAVPFTALLFAAGLAVAWQVHRDAIGPMLRWLGASALLGVLVLGHHPYVTNLLETGNPFHPALRTGGGSILQKMASPDFIERDRFSKFVLANTSRSRPDDWRAPEWFVPGTGWRTTPEVDDRFSGFGEPFAVALILALCVLSTTKEKVVWTIVTGLLASIFITEAGWWARLAPQTWWLPVLAAATCWLPARGPVKRVLGMLILAILGYTIAATLLVVGESARRNTAHVAAALAELEQRSAVIVPNRAAGVVRGAFALTLRQRLVDAGQPLPVVREPRRPCVLEYQFEAAALCFYDRQEGGRRRSKLDAKRPARESP